MRGLVSRLLVLFIAVGAVGCSISYVSFVVWGQAQMERARRAEMRASAEVVLARLSRPRGALRRVLEEIAAEREIWISVVGQGVPELRSGPPSFRGLSAPESALQAPILDRGAIHLTLPVPEQLRPWTYVVASRPANDVFDRVFESQGRAFIGLAIAFVAMIGTGVALAKRSLLAPFERVSRLVATSDHAGLRALGTKADSFAALGRNIAAMNDRIAEDRERIAEQLEQLRTAHRDLSSAQAQLVRAERLAVVGTLAAGLAHEIGNPLAVVGGFVELVADPDLSDEERRAAARRMEQELDRIQSIVRDLLDFSRASSESEGRCFVREALDDLRELLAPQRRFAEVTLQVEVEGEPRAAIEKGALLQILVNLCLNAADAMEGHGRCAIRAEADGDAIRISVEDNGPGIASEARQRIFEPFFTTKPAGLGTGLGLAVCERIAEAVGGALTVADARALGGARFELRIPRVDLESLNHRL